MRAMGYVAAVMIAGVAGLAGPAWGQASKPRDPAVIHLDVADLERRIFTTYPVGTLVDPAKRAEMQEKVLPLMARRLALVKELFAADPKADESPTWVTKYLASLAWMTLLGDADAKKTLDLHAMSDNRALATYSKAAKFTLTWYGQIKNEAELEKLIPQVKGFIKASPKDEVVANFMTALCSDGLTYSDELRDKLEEVVREESNNAVVNRWKATPRLNRPFAIAGTQVNGKPFDTETLKGKVVVVHFWITTDVRYRDHLAKLAEAYTKLKEEGVEFVGISLDKEAKFPQGYLQGHPELSWPQLYDAKAKGGHWLVGALGFPPVSDPAAPPILTVTVIDKEGRFRAGRVAMDKLSEAVAAAKESVKAKEKPVVAPPAATEKKP